LSCGFFYFGGFWVEVFVLIHFSFYPYCQTSGSIEACFFCMIKRLSKGFLVIFNGLAITLTV
jgi:hypothetical protein